MDLDARKCEGCGKSYSQAKGGISAINRGYWHISCWARAKPEQREAPAKRRQEEHLKRRRP